MVFHKLATSTVTTNAFLAQLTYRCVQRVRVHVQRTLPFWAVWEGSLQHQTPQPPGRRLVKRAFKIVPVELNADALQQSVRADMQLMQTWQGGRPTVQLPPVAHTSHAHAPVTG